ncbi:MAG: hypothetical protein Q7R70_05905 [Candidatus Diapherotrites archaeon]|nr:hypothetical protein [Candidatus Diapherotrites archaeon]
MGAGLPIIVRKNGVCFAGEKVTIELGKLGKDSPVEVMSAENARVNLDKNKGRAEIIPEKEGKSIVKIKYYLAWGPHQMEGPLYNATFVELDVKSKAERKGKKFEFYKGLESQPLADD